MKGGTSIKRNMKNCSQRDQKKFPARLHLKTLHEILLLTPIMLCMCLQDQQAWCWIVRPIFVNKNEMIKMVNLQVAFSKFNEDSIN